MIDLRKIARTVDDINPVWTFSRYLKIPIEQFKNSTIKIRSKSNPTERFPSLCIYWRQGKLLFKDWSANYGGSQLDLVANIKKVNISTASAIIISEYNRWVLSGGKKEDYELEVRSPYKIQEFTIRKLNILDRDYWVPFNINSSLLKWGMVKPLSSYKMGNGEEEFTSKGNNIYGYFNRAGSLVKVYQPLHPSCRFMTTNSNYIDGEELSDYTDFVIIQSSKKDALSLKSLGIKADYRVANSENSILPKPYIDNLKKKYKKVITLFDSDEPGIRAMKQYKTLYNLDFVYLNMEKDTSDSIKKHGAKEVLNKIVPLIDRTLN